LQVTALAGKKTAKTADRRLITVFFPAEQGQIICLTTPFWAAAGTAPRGQWTDWSV